MAEDRPGTQEPENGTGTPDGPDTPQESITPNSLKRSRDEMENYNDASKSKEEASDPTDTPTASDERIVTDPNGMVRKKRRGRPKGLTKQPHWKKPGPKPKSN